MGRYLVRRLLLLLPVLLGVTFLTFSLIRIIPGDVVTNMMGVTEGNNEATRARILHELGLDRPLLEQYVWWLGRLLHGDFGYSFIRRSPVIDQILFGLPITLEMTIMSMVIAILIGVPLGVLSAVKRGTALDFVARL